MRLDLLMECREVLLNADIDNPKDQKAISVCENYIMRLYKPYQKFCMQENYKQISEQQFLLNILNEGFFKKLLAGAAGLAAAGLAVKGANAYGAYKEKQEATGGTASLGGFLGDNKGHLGKTIMGTSLNADKAKENYVKQKEKLDKEQFERQEKIKKDAEKAERERLKREEKQNKEKEDRIEEQAKQQQEQQQEQEEKRQEHMSDSQKREEANDPDAAAANRRYEEEQARKQNSFLGKAGGFFGGIKDKISSGIASRKAEKEAANERALNPNANREADENFKGFNLETILNEIYYYDRFENSNFLNNEFYSLIEDNMQKFGNDILISYSKVKYDKFKFKNMNDIQLIEDLYFDGILSLNETNELLNEYHNINENYLIDYILENWYNSKSLKQPLTPAIRMPSNKSL